MRRRGETERSDDNVREGIELRNKHRVGKRHHSFRSKTGFLRSIRLKTSDGAWEN